MRHLIPLLLLVAVVISVGALFYLPLASAPTVAPLRHSSNAAAPEAIVTYCSTFAPIPIPDGTGSFVTGTIMIPEAATILDANVRMNLSHTWIGDLVIKVSNGSHSPTVVNRPLLPASPPDGCGGDNIVGTFVDDEGTDGSWENSCINGDPAYPTKARLVGGDPANPALLSAFKGSSTAGNWSLSVSDNLQGDTGQLESFCMEFTIPGKDATATPTATLIAPTTTATASLLPATITPTGTSASATVTATGTAPSPTYTPTKMSATFTATPTPTATVGNGTATATALTLTPTHFPLTITATPSATSFAEPLQPLYLPLTRRDI